MPERIRDKWRPPLWLVLGVTLGVVLCLPVLGIYLNRQFCAGALAYQKGTYDSPVFQHCDTALLWIQVSIVAIWLIIFFVLWRIFWRPIRGLAERARSIALGEREALEPIEHYGTKEMQDMGQAILDMGRVLQDREAVLRSYADHVTHEFKSPLTVLRGAAELLQTPDLPKAEQERLVTRIDEATTRMTRLLDAQRALAQAQEPFAKGVASLEDAVQTLQPSYANLTLRVDQNGVVPLNIEGVRMVLGHLIGNAAEHGAKAVRFSIQGAVLTVQDDGPGVSQGNQDHIFEPFFTSRRDTGGTGMGLSIVRRMLEAHGATIRLLPDRDGACFEINFRP